MRYEDLVAEPEQELRRICDFVGEDYEPAMLDDRSGATGVAAAHEWWKGDATGPLDRSRSGRWRDEMPPEVQRYAALNLGDLLEEHGYGDAVCRRRGAWPSCRPAMRSTPAMTTCCCACPRPAWPSAGPCPRTIEELHLQEPLVFFGVVGQLDPDRARPAR